MCIITSISSFHLNHIILNLWEEGFNQGGGKPKRGYDQWGGEGGGGEGGTHWGEKGQGEGEVA